jgi:hypothetical protein
MPARPLLRFVAALLLIVIGMAPIGTLAAGPLTVCPHGCAYASIQAAIDAASNGATIKIGRGTYQEQLTISKDLTLAGSGADGTIIDAGGRGDVVTTAFFVTVRLAGLTITGGGSGIRNNSQATLAVSASRIVANPISGIFNEGTLVVDASVISDNRSDMSGGGIYNNEQTMTIKNSRITNNAAPSGGGLFTVDGRVMLANTRLENNRADDDGGGIASVETVLTVNQSVLSGNRAGGKGGGLASYAGPAGDIFVTLTNTQVTNNRADSGGGIHNDAGTVRLRGGVVAGNQADQTGGGIFNTGFNFYAPAAGVLSLAQSRVTGNRAGTDGGGIFNVAPNPVTLERSQVRANTPNDCSGLAC